jgi:hypothetical protein
MMLFRLIEILFKIITKSWKKTITIPRKKSNRQLKFTIPPHETVVAVSIKYTSSTNVHDPGIIHMKYDFWRIHVIISLSGYSGINMCFIKK